MKNKQTILIIDDNSANLAILTEYMELWGFDFMVADNGESGLRKAGKGGDPDLILLDVFMPVMDGFEVCRQLKSNPSTAEIPVIFLTADNDEADKVRGFETGAVDYITKPFHPKEVLARINRHLEIRTLQKQLEAKNAQLENEIIERKKLQIKNLQLQKAESLGQMAGGIAHLFNNYLHVATGNLEMALENLPDDSLIRENLTETMKSVRRCSDVSGAMLTYLGQSFIKTESLDIVGFCRKHLPDLQSQSSANSGINIETDLIDTELIVSANANQMQQVLNHLIINACESIGDNKGRISLTTKTISASYISKFHLLPVDCKPSADTYVCLEVTDTGCGISKEDIHKLSDPFFTTKFTGRGLGLAIISGIVKSWGGCIGVKSKVGHGSSFMVFLPIYVDNSVRQLKKLAQSPQPQQKEFSTVLLVEDHEMVRNMTTVMLEKMGFEVISAVNGVEAVELFRKHKESVSCLITDLSMPELDGWGTLAEIRKIKPDIPAILASGYDEAFAMSRDDLEKPQAFLHKPYSMKELKSAIEQAMDSLFTVN